jgi:hypothetical protein
MAQPQQSPPDAYDIMADDLETAQRARFNESNEKYAFFMDEHELDVLNQIHEFRRRASVPVRHIRRFPSRVCRHDED